MPLTRGTWSNSSERRCAPSASNPTHAMDRAMCVATGRAFVTHLSRSNAKSRVSSRQQLVDGCAQGQGVRPPSYRVPVGQSRFRSEEMRRPMVRTFIIAVALMLALTAHAAAQKKVTVEQAFAHLHGLCEQDDNPACIEL